MPITSFSNQKGGPGKTTGTLGAADVLRRRGKQVLVVDIDPQGHATSGLGVTAPAYTMNDVLAGNSGDITPGIIADAAMPAGEDWEGVDVVAADMKLANREQDQHMGREMRLRTALEGVADQWDHVLVDCPPSLGQLTVNALVASDTIILVAVPRAGAVNGLADMVDIIASVRRHFNPQLQIAGVMVNLVKPRRTDVTKWLGELEENYGDLVIKPMLPERELVAQAATAAAPLSAYGSRAAELSPGFDAIADRILSATTVKESV